MNFEQLRAFLDSKVELYNQKDFITNDPISIPHLFTQKEDIEIAGFLSATLAWGNRKSILNNAKRLMQMMDMSPYEFIMGFTDSELKPFAKFVHRTFNGDDCIYFMWSLKNMYQNYGGLESLFSADQNIKEGILHFRNIFFELDHLARTGKHVSNPAKNAASKRINMFLRWMVRQDEKGVDFGIWQKIRPALLYCPLDVHSGRIARNLGLLERKQDDWKAVEELTSNLRKFDSQDPVKYDYALFGMGVNNSL
jgi:uncharacterized protein (TIGR02757 family)